MKASEIQPRKLVVFDIDDTLVHTQTKVHVVKDGEVVDSLNSHDFTHYRLKPGEEFDFGDFRNAREFFEKSKPIIPMMNQLKRDIATGNKVVMVTARADFDDKELFLDTFRKFGIDIDKVHVYRAGNSKQGTTEERKKAIIKRLLDSGNFTKAIMYDDAKPNLHLFMELKKDHPKTKFYAWHVSLDGEASEYMRESIEEKWSEKYKRSINCSNPKGFSQKAHCAGRKKNEDVDLSMDVAKAVDMLPNSKLKDVIEMRFKYDMTFDEIGKELGVGKDRARQIVMKALRHLRHPKYGLMSEPEVNAYRKRDELEWQKRIGENFGDLLSYPEIVDRISGMMRAMGWKVRRKGDDDFIFMTRGQLEDEWYTVSIGKTADGKGFTYALGTIEEGDPHIGQQDVMPNTVASVSMLADEIRDGFGMNENFADGKKKGKSRPGRVKKAGASCKGSVTDLRARAKKYGGEKGKMYHWCANMKGGRNK